MAKFGGRQKGAKNHCTIEQEMLMKELGINPLEILLRFAAGDWKGLGYASSTKTIVTKDGSVIEVDRIEVGDRITSASQATRYFFTPRRTEVDVTSGGKDMSQSFGELVKNVLGAADEKAKCNPQKNSS